MVEEGLSRVGRLEGIVSHGRASEDKQFPKAIRNALVRGAEKFSGGVPLV